jgi:hypothetical protein
MYKRLPMAIGAHHDASDIEDAGILWRCGALRMAVE